VSETTFFVETAEGPIRHAENLLALRRYADGLPWIGRAIAADPQSGRPHCLLALALFHLAQYRRALKAAEAAALVEPENWWPHGLRSACLRRLRKKRRALKAAQEAVRLGPDVPEALSELLAAQLECNQMRAARTTEERLGAIAPDRVFSHQAFGLVALVSRQWSCAEAHFRRALAIDPQDVEVLNNLGVALFRQGRHLEALERLHDAARLDPTSDLTKANLQGALGWHLRPMVLLITLCAFVVAWGRLDHMHSPLAPAVLIGIAAVGTGWLLWRRARIRALPEPLAVLLRYERQWAPDPTGSDRVLVMAVFLGVATLGAGLVSLALQLGESTSGGRVRGFVLVALALLYIALFAVFVVWARGRLRGRPTTRSS